MGRIDDVHALDEALDRLLADEDPAAPSSLGPLIEIARDARSVLAMRMPVGAQAEHLQMLRNAEPEEPDAPFSPVRRRFAVVALAAAPALPLPAGSAFAASSRATAGQTLFGVKRAFESIGLAMHRNGHSRAAFKFQIVQRRLAELRTVANDPVAEENARAAYEAALDDADAAISSPAGFLDDEQLLDHVETELGRHVAVLNALLDVVPQQAQDGIRRAIDRASAAEQRVAKGRRDLQPGRAPSGRGRRSSRNAPVTSRGTSR